MRRTTIISVLLWTALVAAPAHAQTTLTISVDGFANDEGVARLILFDTRAAYEGNAPPRMVVSLPIKGGRASWTGNEIAPGDYVAVVYHDLDANEKLNRSLFGLPAEPYGYSNNVTSMFGKPDYGAVVFAVGQTSVTQAITVRRNPVAALTSLAAYRNLMPLTLGLVLPLIVLAPVRRWLPHAVADARGRGALGLTVLLFMTASAHFLNAEQMSLMLPDWVPARASIVYATGVLEIVLAVAVMVPRWRRRVGLVIALMLIVFLPANIYAIVNQLPYGGGGIGQPYLFVRVPYQAFLILWTLWATGWLGRRKPVS